MGKTTTTYSVSDVRTALDRLTTNTDSRIKSYQTQVLNNYNALYDKVKAENDRIQQTYEKRFNDHSADAQQSKYVDLSQKILKTVYDYAFWIYIALSIVLYFFIWTKSGYSIPIKIILLIVIFGFPYYIYFLENIIYSYSLYMYYVIVSLVYNNGFSNSSIEYAGQSMEEIVAQNAKSPQNKNFF